MKTEITIISLGAGVQSSTLALMAKHGELETPKSAIFADTGNEPASVYKWLDYLVPLLTFDVRRVRRVGPTLAAAATERRISRRGNLYTKFAVPAFMKDIDGKQGIMNRQCTEAFKIRIIQREIRAIRKELAGSRRADQPHVMQWIGISTDEAHRMKDSGTPYITNIYPLIEAGLSRADCISWTRRKGYPDPPRSSCLFCPFHSDDEWIRLRDDEPAAFADAVKFERDYQAANVGVMRCSPWLHRSMIPLDQVEFKQGPGGRGNECAGVCGV